MRVLGYKSKFWGKSYVFPLEMEGHERPQNLDSYEINNWRTDFFCNLFAILLC